MGIGTGGLGQKLTSQGGVTPEQQALAQYTFGQGAVSDLYKFSEMPHSTNLTQAIAGSRAGEAKSLGQMSQADAAAMQQFINAQTGNLASGIGNVLGGKG